jgi:hypothetical protein
MTGTKFVWNAASSFPRTGPRLETGKEYDASLFPAHVVEEWIRTGAASEVKAAKSMKAAKHAEEV